MWLQLADPDRHHRRQQGGVGGDRGLSLIHICPIAWGREIGFGTVRDQLLELDAAFPGGRYRPSPALERIS